MTPVTNPYAGVRGPWLKAVLHAHSTNSDGSDAPAQVWREYARLGYDVVALTDHNTVPSAAELQTDARVLTLPGCEYRSEPKNFGCPEIGLVGLTSMPPLDVPLEQGIAHVRASNAFAVYHHPNWHFDHWPTKPMFTHHAAHAVEVYNAVVEELQGPAEASDKWDRLLSMGYRIWGVASDDAHHARQRGKAWTMIAATREPAAILAALKAGQFYASTGVAVTAVALCDGMLSVTAPNAQRIRFIVERGAVRVDATGPTAGYTIRADDGYVRVECLGAAGSKAWLNPLFVETPASHKLLDEFRAWYLKSAMT
jgi:predicted metal-dependent phosphoesterase TrpH